MKDVKCEHEKYDKEKIKELIIYMSYAINSNFDYSAITSVQAKLIREILNDYLNNLK